LNPNRERCYKLRQILIEQKIDIILTHTDIEERELLIRWDAKMRQYKLVISLFFIIFLATQNSVMAEPSVWSSYVTDIQFNDFWTSLASVDSTSICTEDEYFEHNSCSFTTAYASCIPVKWDEFVQSPMTWQAADVVITDIVLSCFQVPEARDAFNFAYSQAKDLECKQKCIPPTNSEDLALYIAECTLCKVNSGLGAVLDNVPNAGCVLALWSALALLAQPHAWCIEEAAHTDEPWIWERNWGHPCRDDVDPPRLFCDEFGLDIIQRYECNDCEWKFKEIVQTCDLFERCVETSTGATCVNVGSGSGGGSGGSGGSGSSGPPTWPGNDLPDDNHDVGSLFIQSSAPSPSADETEKVAILTRGYFRPIRSILSDSNVYATLLNPLSHIEPKDYSVLIIPSGGLYGMESSAKFKLWLESYVSSGGTLIAFSQQYGYEYQALPGGDVTGFGWIEDQMCQFASVAISTYLPLFSAFQTPILDVNVDGFYTSYPKNSTILLSRIKNGMPAMLMYEFGNGTVIATNLYSDMARSLHQETYDEKILIRDLISWAKSSGDVSTYSPGLINLSINLANRRLSPYEYPVPEYSSGDLINITVNVTNRVNQSSDKVSFILFGPEFDGIVWVNNSVSITSRQSKNVSLLYQTSNSSKSGIWKYYYLLYKGADIISTGWGGEFTLNYSVNDSAKLEAVMTVKDPDGSLIKETNSSLFILPGKIGSINISLNSDKLGIWSARYSVLTHDEKVYASAAQPFAVSKYQETPGGFEYQGSDLTYSITSDNENYPLGSPALFKFHLWNSGETEKNVTITWGAYYHGEAGIIPEGWDDALSNSTLVPAGGNTTLLYVLPEVVHLDRLRAMFYDDGIYVGSAERGFWVYNPSINVEVEPDSKRYSKGQNVSLSLYLKKRFYDPIYGSGPPSYRLNLKVLDPRNAKIFETNLGINDGDFTRYYNFPCLPPLFICTEYDTADWTGNLSFSLPDSAVSGPYTLVSEVREIFGPFDSGRKIGGSTNYIEIPEPGQIIFDKPSYRAGDNLGFDLILENYLSVTWSQTIEISIPGLSFSDSIIANLNPGETKIYEYNLPLPEDLGTGKYIVRINKVEEGSSKEYNFFIPGSKLSYSFDDKFYTAGENISIDLTNIGGVGANYTFSAKLFDTYSYPVFNESTANVIPAGETFSFDYLIPNGATNGFYFLEIEVENENTGDVLTSKDTLYVEGVSALLSSETDRLVYSAGEDITVLSNITNLNGEILGGILNLRVVSQEPLPDEPCIFPSDDLYINSDTTLCPGVYNIIDVNSDGVLIINESGVVLDGIGVVLNGFDSDYGEGYGYGIFNFENTNVNISNIEINNYDSGIYMEYANGVVIENTKIWDNEAEGIYIEDAPESTIIRNNASNNEYGIFVRDSPNSSIKENVASNNDNYGIHLRTSHDSIVTGNNASNNNDGIVISASDNVTISNNDANSNNGFGIRFSYSNGNIVTDNSLENNYNGFHFSESSGNIFSGNTISGGTEAPLIFNSRSVSDFIEYIDTSNTVDGKPIYYLVGESDRTIGASLNPGFVGIINGDNITVRDLTMNITRYGVLFAGTHNSLIENITANQASIYLFSSNNNTIINNNVTDSGWGVYLEGSEYNTVKNNSLSLNWVSGIALEEKSDYNIIIDNSMDANGKAIQLDHSSNNTITKNNANNNDHCVTMHGSFISGKDNNISYNILNTDDPTLTCFYFSDSSSYYNIIEGNTVNGDIYYHLVNRDSVVIENLILTAGSPSNLGWISVINSTNMTLKNLKLANNYATSGSGLYLYQTTNSIIDNVTTYSNGKGIYLDSSNNNTINGNNVSSNTNGIWIESSSNNTLTGNTASLNLGRGIYIGSSSYNNLTGNNATDNGNGWGIDLSNSNNNILSNNYVSWNNYGIRLSGPFSKYNTLRANIAYLNLDGIQLSSSTSLNSLTDNKANLNTRHGIWLDSSNNNTLTSNKANSNTQYGIYLRSSTDNTLTSNVVNSNYQSGIFLWSSTDNELINNTASSNSIGTYLYSASDNNLFTENNVSNNQFGLYLRSSHNNTITNNIACSNNQYDIYNLTSSSSGVDNTCNTTFIWNDIGTINCTYSCAGDGGESLATFISPPSSSSSNRIDSLWNPLQETQLRFGEVFKSFSEIGLSKIDSLIHSLLKRITGFNLGISQIITTVSAAEASSNNESFSIWETNLTVDVTDTLNISTLVGSLNTTGKLYLYATLYSPTGQIIGNSISSFYITESDLALTMETEKRTYKPNETISITGTVENRGVPKNLSLKIQANESEVYSENISIGENESHPFTTNISASTSFTLQGTVGAVTVTDFIRIEEPFITTSVSAPDIVGWEEFDIGLTIENVGNVSVELDVEIGNESWTTEIPDSELRYFVTNMSIVENTTVNISLSGDVVLALQKEIIYGGGAEINITTQEVYLEGAVLIPFTVASTGVLEERFNTSFSINGQTTIKEIYLPVGSNTSDTLSLNLSKGMHHLVYSSPYFEGIVNIGVESEAEFIVTRLPVNETYNLGERVNLSFTVKNIGGREGDATVYLESPGLFFESNRTWIEGNAEKNITFQIAIPDDVEERSYALIVEINDVINESSIFINGAKIDVNASLDKNYYEGGENASLSMNVSNINEIDLELFSRIQFNGYSNITNFNLSGLDEKTLKFEVPVSFTGDNKMLYSIYMKSGRSLYINSIYVYEKAPVDAGIILYTDKQVYEIGDNVTLFIETSKSGELNLSAPNFNYLSNLSSNISTQISFQVPELLSGTYYIEYTFNNYSLTYPFDINGYFARILELNLDKDDYNSGDLFTLNALLDVNRRFDAAIDIELYDPNNDLIVVYSFIQTFEEGENLISYSNTVTSNYQGMHAIVPRVIVDLVGHSPVTIVSGAEYFDIILANTRPAVDVLNPVPTEPQPTGTNVTWSCLGSDTEGGVIRYMFRIRGPSTNNTWLTKRGYRVGRKWKWQTSEADIGETDVRCVVKDSGRLKSQKTYGDYEITGPVNNPPTVDVLNPTPPEPQTAGTNVTWACLGNDTEDDLLRYMFRIRGPSTGDSWVTVRGFRVGRKWKWVTKPVDIGETDVKCVVKDYPAHNKASKIYHNYEIT
jgi:parallel beta-helix repeat protein